MNPTNSIQAGATPTPATVSVSPFADDHHLVSRLIDMDEAAWAFVVGERILPAVAHSLRWREELYRLSISHDAVATEVFLSLTANDCRHLREFRFDCAFSSFLYNWILAAMKTIRRLHGRETPRDLSVFSGDVALINREASPQATVAAREALEEANRNLAALWVANPVHATVLILRNVEGLKSKDVAGMLGLTPANVDQIFKRAQERFRKLSERSRGNEAYCGP